MTAEVDKNNETQGGSAKQAVHDPPNMTVVEDNCNKSDESIEDKAQVLTVIQHASDEPTSVEEAKAEFVEDRQDSRVIGNSCADIPEQHPSTTESVVSVENETDLMKLKNVCIKFKESQESIQDEPKNQMTDSILSLLVTEDLSSIKSPEVLNAFFIEHMQELPPNIISELLSVLIAIVKKSVFHLESARGLLISCINYLLSDSTKHTANLDDQSESSNPSNVSLTKHFLREWINLLIAHSCDVEELESILKLSEHDSSLLGFIQQANLKQRYRPYAFFAFPGTKGSMMSLPPFQKWPSQNGWSFSTWFFLEPKACAQPYLYNFKTGKSGLGYSAHFTGNCLVLTSIRVKGKGVQHCVAYEFPSYKWTHCAITYHNKWRASEIKVYANGQLAANIEMPWQVQTTEIFDKCFVGGSGSITTTDRSGELNCFCGQMSALYLFNEGLSPAQICALHRLGPSYMGQFKYSNESHVNLPPQISRALYEERLASTLFCLFTPVAVDSGTLCIQLAPLRSSTSASVQNYFISAPHAALLGRTKAIATQPICSTLQSIGCSRSLLPLLDVFANRGDPDACSSLIGFLCDLIESSPHWFANEIVQNNGFVMVACSLASNPRSLLSDKLLDYFLDLARSLLTTTTTYGYSLLLKHFMDNILFNPSLWIYADTNLQVKLYNYLASEFLHGTRRSANKYTISNQSDASQFVAYNPTSSAATANQNLSTYSNGTVQTDDKSGYYESQSAIVTDLLFGEIRRVSTVLQSLHALKYYYWMAEEAGINPKGRNSKLRPGPSELTIIRSHILAFARELILKANTTPLDEVQGILNYLSSCMHPENLLDVLETLSTLIKEHPASMISALDQKQGIKVLFTLIGSKSEKVRISAMKLLSLFLSHCSHKKKQDIMGPNNLFMLIGDRLRAYRPLTSKTYQALMNLMVEADESDCETAALDISKMRIENSMIIKVIASLLHDERISPQKGQSLQIDQPDIRAAFINDLWNLIVNSRENRRIILQMSVWQHWLINLIDSTAIDSRLVCDQVLAIFRVLLYHAIRYEYGGWRVWIDTLAIIHTKVSYDEFCKQLNSQSSDSPAQIHHKAPKTPQRTPTKREVVSGDCGSRDLPKVGNTEDKINDEVDNIENRQPVVSSISETIQNESSGILMDEETRSNDGSDAKIDELNEELKETQLDESESKNDPVSEAVDCTDVAPSRSFRKTSLCDDAEAKISDQDRTANKGSELTRQQSLTSISLDEPINEPSSQINEAVSEESIKETTNTDVNKDQSKQEEKATASPAFRISEFKWSGLLIKLLNDLMFSIECDLYHWRCLTNAASSDSLPFAPKSMGTGGAQSNSSNSNNTQRGATISGNQLESILQKHENQIYIVNIVHFVSQLADNIIIASGGLLPLLADATGGTKNSNHLDAASSKQTCEGLTLPQANSILYRLVYMIDLVVFSASHINLNELEADKNNTSGGILRQCLRLVCTVTVKNCLVLRGLSSRITSMGIDGTLNITESEFPRDMFDSYQGCSLLSANGLFEKSSLSLSNTDLLANVEYSPHQMPNTSSKPSILPFQSTPIKDANKLLQLIDINRIQECIYHDCSTESRQSQFLALSSLYFISVLMVSKYRDIIEPKPKLQDSKLGSPGTSRKSDTHASESKKSVEPVSSTEANLLNFGKMQPNSQSSAPGANALTNMLTTRLENTLDTVCPLLKAIMCDFCSFLSKTLVGSHGQDLVNKEAERTFRRANTSPVELVMLLCSQEWQNTLQKNAGLAFIELINEGRVQSHGMKDHIVRVAMEAEFILSRLRADDVARHEHFGLLCSETLSARLHEELLINSLISTAARRDHILYFKFQESAQNRRRKNYRLDVWEDDDRRKRRFVYDPWGNESQCMYNNSLQKSSNDVAQLDNSRTDTKRILELQQTIELGGIHDHCSPAALSANLSDTELQKARSEKDNDCEDDDYEDDDIDQHHNGSNSPDSESESSRKVNARTRETQGYIDSVESGGGHRGRKFYSTKSSDKSSKTVNDLDDSTNDFKIGQAWDYAECGSVNDFTGSVVFAAECSLIWSIYAIPGIFQLTAHELYFEPNQNISEAIEALKRGKDHGEAHLKMSRNNQSDSPGDTDRLTLRDVDLNALKYCEFLACNGKISLTDIRAIFSRHYLLQPHALELFLVQRTSVMFAFTDFDSVKRAVKYLPPVGVGIKYGIPQTRRASLMSPRQLFSASNMTQKWQKREIGNFQYLMFLNTIAGRTYQDLNQYPVFPWILTNYESEELDLNLPTNFRDLSKPIGALNSKRRSEFIERYQSWDNPKVPAFHYGTHYSTAAFTLNWLCRLRGSYNYAYIALQDGKYEEDSRLFLSIGDSWVSSLVGGQQNVKELIPEFFYLPEMFHSNMGLPRVEFPPWAKSAEEFIRMHRIALESELVSCQLHQWIDLIFGYKQRGPEAINAVNTFYYLTYQGNVNLNMIQDPNLRDAIETQIKHFGQTPSQLTTEPHPPRFSALHASPMVFSSSIDELNKVIKFPFNTPVTHISSCVTDYIASANSISDSMSTGTVQTPNSSNRPSSVLTITSNNQYQINKWMPSENSGHPFTMDPQLDQPSSARRQLIDVDDLCSSITLKLHYAVGTQRVTDEVQWPCAHYIVTLNGHYIIMGSFYDNSFRVFTTESGKLCQVIYGHRSPITCIARSEGNAAADFYIATGSQDCSLLIWTWNERDTQVEGSGVSAVHNPLPKLSLTGHKTPVLSAALCAELGLIVSGSKNLILVHTTANGENIIEIDATIPALLDRVMYDNEHEFDGEIQRPLVQNKQKTILEASMLGDQEPKFTGEIDSKARPSRGTSPSSMSNHKFSHLRDLCAGDYYITNLQLARELAFIVCVALPRPKRKSRSKSDESMGPNQAALLVTFNLKGSLMECTTIGQSVNCPRLGDVCVLQITRDGEHLVLNDSPITIKIYRTFDLQPIYAYNTNDIPDALAEDSNRIKSLALLDHRYILVGLENGKIIVYNADFKNLH